MNAMRFKTCAFALVVLMAPIAPLCNTLDLVPLLDDLCCYFSEDPVKHVESVPTTSATILGLTNFGFLLGIRLNKSHIRMQLRYVTLAFIAIVVVIALQTCLMMYAQVYDLYVYFYSYAMSVTGMMLVVAGACFVMTAVTGFRLGDMVDRNSDDVDRHTADLQDINTKDAGQRE